MISPVTRANGPAWIEVTVSGGQVVEARCSGIFFRGFEAILRGRDPRDASYLTQRVCGICSTAHGVAAAFALEEAAGVQPPDNGNLLRNLILGADFLQNHIRHFYLLGLPDYVRMPFVPPHAPGYQKDFRLPEKINLDLVERYFQAADMSRMAHEMVTILGAKAPHQHGTIAGGSVVPPRADVLLDFTSKLKRVNRFIRGKMIPDAHVIAEAYPDYYEIGSRKANLLEYGLFPKTGEDRERYFPAGSVIDGEIEKVDLSSIRESVTHSWFREVTPLHPSGGETDPEPDKGGAYSWVKAPRYGGRVMEGGPLARLWITGEYRRGVSTMDRTVARTLEAGKIGRLMEEWILQLDPGRPVFSPYRVPENGEGVGLTGSMRGPLGHWVRIKDGRIEHYQIVTPTAWNFSPRDEAGNPGAIEEALTGIPIEDGNQPVEIGRVIRAFDVCFSCATHVVVLGKKVRKTVITV